MATIVWDVDDVLNDLMYRWFVQAWKRENPECLIEYAGLTDNPPHGPLGVTREEYLVSMDQFRKTEAGINLTPSGEVLDWFRKYGSRFRHIALTARPLETAPELASWVIHHFGEWIRCFCVAPTRMEAGTATYDRSKGDYLRWLGKGDVLVDDGEENLAQAAELGLLTVTWPQPWNHSTRDAAGTLGDLLRKAADRD